MSPAPVQDGSTPFQDHHSATMAKSIKKQYLKALNKRLKKESDGKPGTEFVFYPPGSKSKDATGVTASGPADEKTLAIMEAVQAQVFAQFEGTTKTRQDG